MTFDELRTLHPMFGFAAYAIEPGNPVTLEIFAFGNVATFHGPTLEHCIGQAFPAKPNGPLPAPEQDKDILDVLQQEAPPLPSVFD